MTIEQICAVLVGLFVGHFLNKCIYRLPRDLSPFSAHSVCPHCSTEIAWFDSIPVVSYLALRGRCRKCATRIAVRYLLVELLTPALFVYYVSIFGATPHALKYCIFSAILITLTFTGLEELMLPDEFTLGGAALGLILSWFVAPDGSESSGWAGLASSFSGALLPSVGLWLVNELHGRIRRREGLGFGDVKTLAMIGSFIGLGGAVLTMVVGFALGLVVGITPIVLARKDASTFELATGPIWSIAVLVAVAITPIRTLWVGMNAWWAALIGHF